MLSLATRSFGGFCRGLSAAQKIQLKTEKEKMLAGEMYNPSDPELLSLRENCRKNIEEFNKSSITDLDGRKKAMTKLFGKDYPNLYVEPPFYCDYGTNIKFKGNAYFNYNCILLDVCPITIGDNVMFAPNVGVYTATHPTDAKTRNSGREYAKPITIGDNCWIGGSATICPGVTIGDNCVIGAGSVVTRDIPANSFAAGVPCRVIREITEADSMIHKPEILADNQVISPFSQND